MLLKKYPTKESQNGKNINFDSKLFRPNIVIDTEDGVSDQLASYFEEEIQVAKLTDEIYLRSIGPSIKCKLITINWQTDYKRDDALEPYMTLFENRSIPNIGIAFGVYY